MGVGDVPDAELVARFDHRHEAARLLHEMPVPTIAMVNGVAAGAGLALALACDLRIVGASAKFASAYAHVGFSGDFGGTFTLQRLVGPSRARQFYFCGETLGADEAQAIGMVDRVVPDALLRDATTGLAHAIASGPPLALRAMKRNMNLALTSDMATVLRAEARASVAMMRTEDNQEALAAFVAKRKPTFVGR
jgi:2-(1,2-epoxy-1,2-dihydrophenyl)acetyl-CoA isomerase